MSYCLNPNCKHPQNPKEHLFCQSCGAKLLLKERYHAIKPIGQGGFGRTFLGIDRDLPLKPPRVIKQFLPTTQGTESLQKATELFNQEAVRLDELGKHPQIPELFAHFEQDKYLYLVQEYIDGENLDQILKKEGIFKEIQIRELLLNLLPVLQFIHEHNVIHRDIKPENIIRRHIPPFSRGVRGDRYVLVDFGAARYVTGTAILKTGTIIGDHRYMPDEQLKGKTDFTSDLYSLGLTCLHLLTQVEPWDLYDNSEDKWVWRDYLTVSISNSLGQVLDKMIQKGTKRRYQSATEILNALNPIVTISSSPSIKVSQLPSSQTVSATLQTVPTPFELKNQWVYEDADGMITILPRFDRVEGFLKGLARVKIGSKYGYIDTRGKIVVPIHFDDIGNFYNGLARAKINSKWGYIDTTGNISIPPQFDDICNFFEGLARVKIGSKWGYIDKIGKVVIPIHFDDGYSFSNGLARVKIGYKWGYINKTGKIVIPLQFDDIKDFSEGLSAVKIDSKWGYIDTTGKIVISPQFDVANDFKNGKARVTQKISWLFKKRGYIDKTSQFIGE